MKKLIHFIIISLSCLFVFAQQIKFKNTLRVNNDISKTVSVEYFGLKINKFHDAVNTNDSLMTKDLNGDNLPELIRIEKDSLHIHLNISAKLSLKPVISINIKNTLQVKMTRTKWQTPELQIIFKNNTIRINDKTFGHILNYNTEKVSAGKHTMDSLDFSIIFQGPGLDTTSGDHMQIDDIDNDGITEAIFAYSFYSNRPDDWDRIVIYERLPDDTYVLQTEFLIDTTWGYYISYFTIDDIDNNGYKEIILGKSSKMFLYEYAGGNNFDFYTTNINYWIYDGQPSIKKIYVGDFNNNGVKDLLTLASTTYNRTGPSTVITLNEFLLKDTLQHRIPFNQYLRRLEYGYVYNISPGDLDNDGFLEIIYGDIGFTVAEPDTFHWLEYDYINNTFQLFKATSGFPGGPGVALIDDIDGDSLNELVISGPGHGNGTFFIMEASAPNQLYLVQHDSTSLETGPLVITGGFINGKYSIIIPSDDLSNITFPSQILHLKQNLSSNFEDIWLSQKFDDTYIFSLFLNDIDNDHKENIIFLGRQSGIFQCNLIDLEKTTISGIPESNHLPTTFELLQNYPNPFNSVTNIPITTNKYKIVNLVIYNVIGELIYKKSIHLKSGTNLIRWNGKDLHNYDLPSGVYFYNIQSKKKNSLTHKLILLK
jgi:hypothetical protein